MINIIINFYEAQIQMKIFIYFCYYKIFFATNLFFYKTLKYIQFTKNFKIIMLFLNIEF